MTITYFSDDMRNIVPYMSGYSMRSVIASASGEASGYEAWKAFDRSVDALTNYWKVEGTRSAWLMIDFGEIRTVSSYGITAHPLIDGVVWLNMMPRDWTFQGSYDGSYWITLQTITYQTFDDVKEIKEYALSSPASYRYYRLNITSNYFDYVTGLGELSLFGTKKTMPYPTGIVTLSGTINSADASSLNGYAKNGVIAILKMPGGEYSPIVLPISSFNLQRESGGTKYIQIVIPGTDSMTDISDRMDGTLVLYHSNDGSTTEIGSLPLTSIRFDQGAINQSVTLQANA